MSDSIISKNRASVNMEKYRTHRKECESLASVYKYLFEEALFVADQNRWEDKEDRVRHCGTFLMGSIYEKGNERKYVLEGANFCRVMLCPMCQWRRALKLYSSMLRIWKLVFDDYRVIEFDESKHRIAPPLRGLLLTLTVPNCSGNQLRDQLELMAEAWDRLVRTKQFRQSIKGYYRCVEVTYNASNDTYHPHYHVLLLVTEDYFSKGKDDYIAQEQWLEMWRKAMRDNTISQVDIRALRGSTPQAMLKNLNETCKYTCKPSDFLQGSIEQRAKIVETVDKALDGIRRASFGGWLKEARRALKLDDEDELYTDESEEVLSEWRKVVPMVWLHWDSGLGDYIE